MTQNTIENNLAYFIDLKPPVEDFSAAVAQGLSQSPKELPCRFFYDEAGSTLFEKICATEEYYVTRTEMGLLEKIAPDIAAIAGPGVSVVEFGTGSSAKIRILLSALDAPAAYIPIDISREHLIDTANGVAADYPDVAVGAICGDFVNMAELPGEAGSRAGPKLGFFPGSTIGNFTPDDARKFLSRLRGLLGSGEGFVIGVDLKKDIDRLNEAYNDAAGYTAAFNKNVLVRLKNELKVDLDLDQFEHVAFYNEAKSRVEMHLRSLATQSINLDGRAFALADGEMIHTENSCKYSVAGFRILAREAGFECVESWTDDKNYFSIHYLRVPDAG
jgi:L-histidine Nalpha-methyltransferase